MLNYQPSTCFPIFLKIVNWQFTIQLLDILFAFVLIQLQKYV